MIKRVVVAGCRYYNNYEEAKAFIDFCIANIKKGNDIAILSGGCAGADMLGERYANERGYSVERYVAQWGIYGRAAGPIRNEEMAKSADYVICFWDGKSKGTRSLIELAAKHQKPIRIKNINSVLK